MFPAGGGGIVRPAKAAAADAAPAAQPKFPGANRALSRLCGGFPGRSPPAGAGRPEAASSSRAAISASRSVACEAAVSLEKASFARLAKRPRGAASVAGRASDAGSGRASRPGQTRARIERYQALRGISRATGATVSANAGDLRRAPPPPCFAWSPSPALPRRGGKERRRSSPMERKRNGGGGPRASAVVGALRRLGGSRATVGPFRPVEHPGFDSRERLGEAAFGDRNAAVEIFDDRLFALEFFEPRGARLGGRIGGGGRGGLQIGHAASPSDKEKYMTHVFYRQENAARLGDGVGRVPSPKRTL